MATVFSDSALRSRTVPFQPDGKTQSQVVADALAKALTESAVGQRLATMEAPDGGTLLEMDPCDPAAVWEVLQYFASELLALKTIVKSLAAAADDRMNGL